MERFSASRLLSSLLGKKPRTPDLQTVIENTDLDVTGVRIIPVYDSIHDGLPQRLSGLIPLLIAGGFDADIHAHADVPLDKIENFIDRRDQFPLNPSYPENGPFVFPLKRAL